MNVTWVRLFWSDREGGWLRVGEASVPMVLRCEVGIAEGKPLMEQYGLEELAASAEAVLAGPGAAARGGAAGPGCPGGCGGAAGGGDGGGRGAAPAGGARSCPAGGHDAG